MNIQLGTFIGATLLTTSVALSGMQGTAPGQLVEPAQLRAQAQAQQKREQLQEQERQREVEKKRQNQRQLKQKAPTD
jgi:hypothetical protein